MRYKSGLSAILLVFLARLIFILPFALLTAGAANLDLEGMPPSPPAEQTVQTNSQETVSAYLRLHEEVRATQLAIEQNGQMATDAVRKTAEALFKGLQAIQASMAVQRTQDFEAMQRWNQVILTAVAVTGAMGFLAMVTMVYLQWRTHKSLARISVTLRLPSEPGSVRTMAALDAADTSNLALPDSAQGYVELASESGDLLRPGVKHHKAGGRSLERRLFPGAGNSFRRKQFRALKTALAVGLIFAAAVALVLYLVYTQRPV
ncbi:MAG TPA: hypothetical protein P5205_17825 [Candidatus Paceibacterota bacterium]|nr:hypothetical protein [Candidatus Paceibacterota bacterium]